MVKYSCDESQKLQCTMWVMSKKLLIKDSKFVLGMQSCLRILTLSSLTVEKKYRKRLPQATIYFLIQKMTTCDGPY